MDINKLRVGDKVYEGENVSDGFFDRISNLKTLDKAALNFSTSYVSVREDYENVLKILKTSQPIPLISLNKTQEILKHLKPAVTDYYSISGAHYKYSGVAGAEHLQHLLNIVIGDLNSLELDELSTVLAGSHHVHVSGAQNT